MAKCGLLAVSVVLGGANVAWVAMAGGFGPLLGAVAYGASTVLVPRSGSVERLPLPESAGPPCIWVVAWGRRVGRPI